MLGGVHKVDNVVGVLEVEATTPPARLVSVKYFPSKFTSLQCISVGDTIHIIHFKIFPVIFW